MNLDSLGKYQWQPINRISNNNLARNQVYNKTTIEPKKKQGKESREKRITHQ